MNILNSIRYFFEDLYWDTKFKIEDVIFSWKDKAELAKWDKENSIDFDSEEVKPKKKKKSVKKAKKSV